MRIKLNFLLLLFIWFFTNGCIRDVNELNYPEGSSKIFLYSAISPDDSIIIVSVKKLLPYFNNRKNNSEGIENAHVVLSDGIRSVDLEYTQELVNDRNDVLDRSSYRITSKEFQIEGGKTYYLTVDAPGYPSVKAQCTVPSNMILQSVKKLPMVQNDTVENWWPIEVVWYVMNPSIIHKFYQSCENKNAYSFLPGDTQVDLTTRSLGTILYPKIDNNLLKVTFNNHDISFDNDFHQSTIKEVKLVTYDDVMFRSIYEFSAYCNGYYTWVRPLKNLFVKRSYLQYSTSSELFLLGGNISPGTISIFSDATLLNENQYSIDYEYGKVTIKDPEVINYGKTLYDRFNNNCTSKQPIDPTDRNVSDTTFNFEENLFSEPINYYTNIEDGVGMFWAFNSSTVKIE